MTEEQMVDVPNEGQNNFDLGAGDNTPEATPAEKKETDDTQATEGEEENTQEESQENTDGVDTDDTDDDDPEDAKLPFHKQKRWIEREDEWKTRFNEQETRHQTDIQKLREEFGTTKSVAKDNTEIPSWFGGTPEQWSEYQKHEEQRLESFEKKFESKNNEAKLAEDKAIKEATDYMQSEISVIESDKKLNPEGKKIDANKLLKLVIDNDLVDSKGRWNYKAGMAFYKHSVKPIANIVDRKKIAAANTSENKGETKPTTFKTSEDFKKDRPW
jgi:hypothetical protein